VFNGSFDDPEAVKLGMLTPPKKPNSTCWALAENRNPVNNKNSAACMNVFLIMMVFNNQCKIYSSSYKVKILMVK
jgi:hypothetical protein